MAMAGGALLHIGGTALGGESAEAHKAEYKKLMDALEKPDVKKEEQGWFNDLEAFFPRADKLSQQLRENELEQNLRLREKALPGSTQALKDAMASVSPLLRGELPDSVMSNFVRAGGASTVGLGFGGSSFGALNTGLFGARGSLGAVQTGMGLLPSLLSSMPSISAPTTMGLLGQLMTPQQRVNLQMQLRQQQIGINSTYAAMPTREDVWAQSMKEAGSMMMGMGGMGGMGGGGGGGGFGAMNYGSGMNAGGYSGGGAAGGWSGGGNWAAGMA